MTRAEARRRAQQLVDEGRLAQDRAQTFVDDMVESSRRRADELLDVVRTEFQRQVKALGIATKEDLARLEAKVTGKKKQQKKQSGSTKKKSGSASVPPRRPTEKQAKPTKKGTTSTRAKRSDPKAR